MKKLAYIDALRGLAILAVIMVHTHQYGNINSTSLNAILDIGVNGAQLFFVISAFTLFLSYKTRSTTESFPIRNFFIRRFFRIAPMYYIGIVYYLFQDGLGPRFWLGDATHISVWNILSNISFLHGLNPYWIASIVPGGWTVTVEMMVYMILPFLFTRIKNINQALLFFILTLLLKFILQEVLFRHTMITDDRLWLSYLYFYFPSQLPVFAIGIIMYFIICDKQENIKVKGYTLLVLCIMIVAQLSTDFIFVFNHHILFGIVFLILGIGLSKQPVKLLVNPFICYVGKISFSMYLAHFAVLHWLAEFNFVDYFPNPILNYFTRFILVIIITMSIASLTYILIEVPFQHIGKNLINQLERKQAAIKLRASVYKMKVKVENPIV